MTIMGKTTLAKRGVEFAKGPNMRDLAGLVLGEPYSKDNPNGFINIGTAENYALIPDIVDFCKERVKFEEKDFTYGEGPWGYKGLRKAMARHMEKYFKSVKPVDADDILFASGVTALCEMLGLTIADEGDGILFSRPIYQAFQMDFGLRAKCTPLFTDFDGVDQFSLEGVKKYEEALLKAEQSGTKVRALMLCNPHNPLGQCYPKDTIIALMKLCKKYQIHLLCDEIYASSVYDVSDKEAVPFTSVLSFDTTPYIDTDLLHVLYGLSKDFAAGGTRLGCIYIRNKELMRAMSAIDMFAYPSGLSQRFAQTLLEDDEFMTRFLSRNRKLLSEKNALVRQILDEAGIDYHRGANAGFFTWMDLRPYLWKFKGTTTAAPPYAANNGITAPQKKGDDPWEAERNLRDALFENKVFVTDGGSLSCAEPGWFRLIFSQHDDVLKAGLRRVFEVIGVDSPTATSSLAKELPLR